MPFTFTTPAWIPPSSAMPPPLSFRDRPPTPTPTESSNSSFANANNRWAKLERRYKHGRPSTMNDFRATRPHTWTKHATNNNVATNQPPRGEGQYRVRDQREHILSYNPLRRPAKYRLKSVPFPSHKIDRYTQPKYEPIINDYSDPKYPSEVIPRTPWATLYNNRLDDPYLEDIDRIAQLAARMPPRYRLLTLQQAIWVSDYIDKNYWPTSPWSDPNYLYHKQRETAAACYAFIEDAFGPDPNVPKEVTYHGL